MLTPLWLRLEAIKNSLKPQVTRQLQIFFVVVVVVSVLSFLVGARFYSEAMVEKRQQVLMLASANKKLADLHQKNVNLDIADKVNKASLEQLRKQVTLLQGHHVEQQAELGLYRNVLKDKGDPDGVYVDTVILRKTAQQDIYSYSIVVRRKGVLSKMIEAYLTLNIVGKKNGQPLSIAFDKADDTLLDDGISIRFKYFKVLRGSFVLPEKFVPEKIVVSVVSNGEGAPTRVKEQSWIVAH